MQVTNDWRGTTEHVDSNTVRIENGHIVENRIRTVQGHTVDGIFDMQMIDGTSTPTGVGIELNTFMIACC